MTREQVVDLWERASVIEQGLEGIGAGAAKIIRELREALQTLQSEKDVRQVQDRMLTVLQLAYAEDRANETFRQEGVNWADLKGVVEGRSRLDDTEQTLVWDVVVDEADPNAQGFAEWVEDKYLEMYGERIRVRTEW